jgi:hypothetical protein
VIRINPWRGDRYEEGFAGRKVLVCGESNYDPRPQDQWDDHSDLVIENVRDCVFSNGSVAFFTKTARLLLRATGDKPALPREARPTVPVRTFEHSCGDPSVPVRTFEHSWINAEVCAVRRALNELSLEMN